MTQRGLRSLLGVALVSTLIAAWFAPPAQDDGVALSERSRQQVPGSSTTVSQPVGVGTSRSASVSSSLRVDVLGVRPRKDGEEDDSREELLFSPAQWALSAKKAPGGEGPALEAPPAPPQAPPLPFRVLGRYEEAGQPGVFLQYFEQNLVVRVGDTIAEQYKVESLNGTTLTLRYLPMDQVQTLELGSAQ